ncbi:MAG: (d)CMP kinase [Gemmatimonadota bacterium]|nr:MAG: (d)CMP kinase [Gemmatimonadota bacterium]
MKGPIIAIDGTAASGKSTTARKVAEHFHYVCVDTGAMYRAVTLKALRQGIDMRDRSALAKMVRDTNIAFEPKNGSVRILCDHEDVTEKIRMPDVTRNVSAVSEVKEVREALVLKQRELGREGGVVMEGRDIGTVVFPQADVKVFMDADVQERARRRGREYEDRGIQAKSTELTHAIQERDTWDSSRIHSPMRKAADAQYVDTTQLTIEEQVSILIKKVEHVLKQNEKERLE